MNILDTFDLEISKEVKDIFITIENMNREEEEILCCGIEKIVFDNKLICKICYREYEYLEFDVPFTYFNKTGYRRINYFRRKIENLEQSVSSRILIIFDKLERNFNEKIGSRNFIPYSFAISKLLIKIGEPELAKLYSTKSRKRRKYYEKIWESIMDF